MKKINKRQIAGRVIKSEISSLNLILKNIGKGFEKACDTILSCDGKVITIGIGKSGYIAAKAAATFSSTGTPSLFLHAAEALHGDMGVISKNDVIIFLSNSGETDELLHILPLIKLLKIPIISITGTKKSALSKASHIVLDSGVRHEACPLNLTPTSSILTALSIADALAITLLESRGFTSKDFAKSHPQGELGKRLLKKVGNLMYTKNLPLLKNNAPLKKAISTMTKFNLGIVVMVDKNKKVLGIFTDGDLRRTLERKPDISKLMIYDVMTKRPILIPEDMLAAESLNLMEEREITSLLVSDERNRLKGILTLNELIKSGIS